MNYEKDFVLKFKVEMLIQAMSVKHFIQRRGSTACMRVSRHPPARVGVGLIALEMTPTRHLPSTPAPLAITVQNNQQNPYRVQQVNFSCL